MDFEQVITALRDYKVPGPSPGSIFLLPQDAMFDIYRFIVDGNLRSCIELGTGHGATGCIMAAAVRQLGGGRVVTIDKHRLEPVNAEVLKAHTGIGDELEVVIDPLGYNWYLADLIRSQTRADGLCQPVFDFCLLDGAHEWEPDALAFLLIAKLLKPGGWIVLDDINFRLRDAPFWKQAFGHMTDKQLDTCQIGMVWDLVVRQHPDFCNFTLTHGGRLGWAQKKALASSLRFSRIRVPDHRTEPSRLLRTEPFRLLKRAWSVHQERGLSAVCRSVGSYVVRRLSRSGDGTPR